MRCSLHRTASLIASEETLLTHASLAKMRMEMAVDNSVLQLYSH
jgi:hypothetical protein